MNTQPGHYKIGAVSKLTGVPTETLRVWERRYNTVEPQRTEGGSRLYSEEDVTRLRLMKRLVSAGDAIGTVANLSVEQLSDRLSSNTEDVCSEVDSRPTRLVLVGPTLAPRFGQQHCDPEVDGIDLVGVFPSAEDCQVDECDVVVAECPALDANSLSEVRALESRCGAARAVVVFGYGSSEHVDALTKARITPLRFPVSWEELRWVCRPKLSVNRPEPESVDFDSYLYQKVPARLFDDEALQRVATMPVALKCECPRHLADIVMNLARFEYYSSLCENSSREDAALHAYLHVTTAAAREMMEQALARLAEAEGFELSGATVSVPEEE